jgi:hypothetical protein
MEALRGQREAADKVIDDAASAGGTLAVTTSPLMAMTVAVTTPNAQPMKFKPRRSATFALLSRPKGRARSTNAARTPGFRDAMFSE